MFLAIKDILLKEMGHGASGMRMSTCMLGINSFTSEEIFLPFDAVVSSVRNYYEVE